MRESKTKRKMLLLTGMLLIIGVISVRIGRFPLTTQQVFRAICGYGTDAAVTIIGIRLPRILLACLVGAALSAAGCSYQGIFQNPMAAPDILGASSGAGFGAALAILLGCSRLWITCLAFFSGILSVLLTYLVGQKARGRKIVNLVLAGMMISSFFSAGISYLKLVADPSDQLPAITYWLMGSLSGAKMSEIQGILLPMLLGMATLLLLRWRINVLSFGDEEAHTMGVNASRIRLVVIICATLLTASSVAVSGMIGWVGLVIPHLCRRLVGNDYRSLLPASMLMGASFLLLADDFSRNLLATEIPIGILTALVGAPFFIYLMLGEERFV